mmetsp:Transcript_3799/g.8041  ORF Transcript_3799/g.8041 Transcript_3799/m.8041 type:complete len:275 (+) Transcript_3799:208-1032(+)
MRFKFRVPLGPTLVLIVASFKILAIRLLLLLLLHLVRFALGPENPSLQVFVLTLQCGISLGVEGHTALELFQHDLLASSRLDGGETILLEAFLASGVHDGCVGCTTSRRSLGTGRLGGLGSARFLGLAAGGGSGAGHCDGGVHGGVHRRKDRVRRHAIAEVERRGNGTEMASVRIGGAGRRVQSGGERISVLALAKRTGSGGDTCGGRHGRWWGRSEVCDGRSGRFGGDDVYGINEGFHVGFLRSEGASGSVYVGAHGGGLIGLGCSVNVVEFT